MGTIPNAFDRKYRLKEELEILPYHLFV